MQLREVGNKIQILRAEYVKAERDERGNLVKGTGRTKVHMLGSFPRYSTTIQSVDKELLAQLDAAELADLEEHFKARKEEARKVQLETAPASICLSLRDLSKAEDVLEHCSDDQVQQIRKALSELLAARRAAKRKS